MLIDADWEPNRLHHLNHFAFQLPSKEAVGSLYYTLKEKGVSVTPLKQKGPVTHFFIEDPDGNGIELYHMENKDFNSVVQEESVAVDYHPEERAEDMSKTLGHIHLYVNDLEQTLAFYHDILEFNTISNENEHHLVGDDARDLFVTLEEDKVDHQSSVDFIAFQVPTMEALMILKQRLEDKNYDFYFNRGKQIIQLWDENRISYWIQAVES